jgi:hypothetical protein
MCPPHCARYTNTPPPPHRCGCSVVCVTATVGNATRTHTRTHARRDDTFTASRLQERGSNDAGKRPDHLNATDMLHILISALCPAIRQLFSRKPETLLLPDRRISCTSDPLSAGSCTGWVSSTIQDANGGGDRGNPVDTSESELVAAGTSTSVSTSGVTQEALLEALSTLLQGDGEDAEGVPGGQDLRHALRRLAAGAADNLKSPRRAEPSGCDGSAGADACEDADLEELEAAASEVQRALEASAAELEAASGKAAAVVASAKPAQVAAAVSGLGELTPEQVLANPQLAALLQSMAEAAVAKGSAPHLNLKRVASHSEQVGSAISF